MTLRLRLTLLYSAIVALTLAAFGVALYAIVAGSMASVLRDTLHDEADRLVRGKMVGPGGIALPVSRFGAPESYVQTRDAGGRVVDRTNNLGAVVLPLDDAASAAAGAGRASTEEVELDGTRFMVHSVPVMLGERSAGIVQVARSLAEQDRALATLRSILFATGGVAVGLAFGAGWLLAGLALRPIGRIAEAARAIGEEHDLGRRVPGDGRRDELGRLAATFNGMLVELQAAHERVARALDVQRRFVSDASHELRTPLTSLRGNIGLLMRDPPIAAEDRLAVHGDMLGECERLIRLVNDLLQLARAGAGRPPRRDVVPVGPLLAEVGRQARLLRDGRVVEIGSGPSVAVLADGDAVRQILLILLDNALKFSPPGAPVALAVSADEAEVAIAVRDDGPGIPAAALPHVTERFYRGEASRTSEGAGLGLAIARSLAEAHGGELAIESWPGGGTRATVRLPRARVGERVAA